jgi:translation elongation factor EF-4
MVLDCRSKGYASFDYEDAGYAASDLVKVRKSGFDVDF